MAAVVAIAVLGMNDRRSNLSNDELIVGQPVISSYMACGCSCPSDMIQVKSYSKSKGEEGEFNTAVQQAKEATAKCNPLAGCSNTPCTKLVLVE